jgi:hypothetical protein
VFSYLEAAEEKKDLNLFTNIRYWSNNSTLARDLETSNNNKRMIALSVIPTIINRLSSLIKREGFAD